MLRKEGLGQLDRLGSATSLLRHGPVASCTTPAVVHVIEALPHAVLSDLGNGLERLLQVEQRRFVLAGQRENGAHDSRSIIDREERRMHRAHGRVAAVLGSSNRNLGSPADALNSNPEAAASSVSTGE